MHTHHDLSADQLEIFWRRLAEAINSVGAKQESLFLAKLALLLVNQCPDFTVAQQAIDDAKANLNPDTKERE